MGGRRTECTDMVSGDEVTCPWSCSKITPELGGEPYFWSFRIMFYAQFYDLTFKERTSPVKFIEWVVFLENTTVVKNGFRTVYFHRIAVIPHAYIT